jgi:hypothetical protein
LSASPTFVISHLKRATFQWADFAINVAVVFRPAPAVEASATLPARRRRQDADQTPYGPNAAPKMPSLLHRDHTASLLREGEHD